MTPNLIGDEISNGLIFQPNPDKAVMKKKSPTFYHLVGGHDDLRAFSVFGTTFWKTSAQIESFLLSSPVYLGSAVLYKKGLQV